LSDPQIPRCYHKPDESRYQGIYGGSDCHESQGYYVACFFALFGTLGLFDNLQALNLAVFAKILQAYAIEA